MSKKIELKSSSSIRSNRLARLSHLYLNGKNVQTIGDLSACVRLKVLYLHHNVIRCITNLTVLQSLTQLYLQNNRIERIEGLETLVGLKKLFLGMNEIRKVENLERLVNLSELHLERQRWAQRTESSAVDGVTDDADAGDSLTVDESSVEALSGNLKVLNITGLRLKSMLPFGKLYRLQTLMAAENAFESAHELGQQLAAFPLLHKVDLHGCPAHRALQFKEHLLESAHQIDILDDIPIPRITRRFMRDLALARVKRQNTRNKLKPEPSVLDDGHPPNGPNEPYAKMPLHHSIMITSSSAVLDAGYYPIDVDDE